MHVTNNRSTAHGSLELKKQVCWSIHNIIPHNNSFTSDALLHYALSCGALKSNDFENTNISEIQHIVTAHLPSGMLCHVANTPKCILCLFFCAKPLATGSEYAVISSGCASWRYADTRAAGVLLHHRLNEKLLHQ